MAKNKKNKKRNNRNRAKPRFNLSPFTLYDRIPFLPDEPYKPFLTCHYDSPSDEHPSEVTFQLNLASLMSSTHGTGIEMPMSDPPSRPVNPKLLAATIDKYQAALEQLGIAETEEQALKKDLIDIRMMATAIKTDIDLQAAHMQHMFSGDPFYNAIPCFNKGTLLETGDGVATWEILGIDVEKRQYTVKISNYLATNVFSEQKETQWFLSDFHTTTVEVIPAANEDDMATYLFHTKLTDICERPQLYRSISLNALGFSDEEKYSFNKGLVSMSDWHSENMLSTNRVTGFMFSQLSFVYVITAVNMFLEKKTARKPAKEALDKIPAVIKNQETKKPEHQISDETPPTKTVRIVDMLTFASTTIPRKPTERTVIKYLTPVWQVRGHVRRYKSGKTAYIPPHVNKRKKLMDKTDANVPQQIIRIRDNTDNFITEEN